MRCAQDIHMQKKNKMKDNKLIAEFMGWTPCDSNDNTMDSTYKAVVEFIKEYNDEQ